MKTNLIPWTAHFVFAMAHLLQGADTIDALQMPPPAVDIATGRKIPSAGYCDQPYVVMLEDGTWLCTDDHWQGTRRGSKDSMSYLAVVVITVRRGAH